MAKIVAVRCAQCHVEMVEVENVLTGDRVWVRPKGKRGKECLRGDHSLTDVEYQLEGDLAWREPGPYMRDL